MDAVASSAAPSLAPDQKRFRGLDAGPTSIGSFLQCANAGKKGGKTSTAGVDKSLSLD